MSLNPFNLQSRLSAQDVGAAAARAPASERVYQALRRQIVALEILPDATLDRAGLAEAFGVSQSPVREAIRRLEEDGLARAYPQSRTVVLPISTERVMEEHFLRRALECEVVRQLALDPAPDAILKARGLLRMQEAIAGDVAQIEFFRELDDAFHESLFAGAGHAALHHHLAARSGHMARVRLLDLPREGKMRAVLEAHQAVLAAIDAGAPDRAADAMRVHLSGTIERLEEIKASRPELFG